MKIVNNKLALLSVSIGVLSLQPCMAERGGRQSIDPTAESEQYHLFWKDDQKLSESYQHFSHKVNTLFSQTVLQRAHRQKADDCFLIDGIRYISDVSKSLPKWFGFSTHKELHDSIAQTALTTPQHAFSLPDVTVKHENARYVLAFKFLDTDVQLDSNQHWLEWHFGLYSQEFGGFDQEVTHDWYSGLNIDIVQLIQPL